MSNVLGSYSNPRLHTQSTHPVLHKRILHFGLYGQSGKYWKILQFCWSMLLLRVVLSCFHGQNKLKIKMSHININSYEMSLPWLWWSLNVGFRFWFFFNWTKTEKKILLVIRLFCTKKNLFWWVKEYNQKSKQIP